MLRLGSKVLSFFALVCIQTIVALMFKLSQRNAHYIYAPSSAQTSAEVIKLVISCALLTRVVLAEIRPDVELGTSSRHFALVFRVWSRFRQDVSMRLVVALGGLAALYCFNNQLAFTVFRLADAASVTLVKSASTAVSAGLLWLLLSRPVTQHQLVCIALQSLGLFVAQYDACKHASVLPLYVYLLLLLSLLITSLSGVANEQLLKGEIAHMHVQNTCLYIYGILLNLTIFSVTERQPFFHGYSFAVWGVITCQALLGITVTFVLKYADMVVRCLASSCAVSALYAINILFMGFQFNPVYFAGALTVFLSTYMYFSIPAPSQISQNDASTLNEVDTQPPAQDRKKIWEGFRWLQANSGVLLLFAILAVVLYAEADSAAVR